MSVAFRAVQVLLRRLLSNRVGLWLIWQLVQPLPLRRFKILPLGSSRRIRLFGTCLALRPRIHDAVSMCMATKRDV